MKDLIVRNKNVIFLLLYIINKLKHDKSHIYDHDDDEMTSDEKYSIKGQWYS